MSASPLSLEQILAVEGDTLYRVALLLGGDERAAARLLADMARRELRGWARGDDQAALIGALYAAALRQPTPKPRRPGPPQRSDPSLSPIFQRLLRLPPDQRLTLGLRLLLGYDSARLAAAGLPPEQSGPLYATALRSLAAPARMTISDYGPEDLCAPLRAAVSEASGQLGREPALRGHLASCSHCRAFDHSWAELTRAVERALREQLRYPSLPAALRTRMLDAARPAQVARPRLRLLLVPLAVLLFIAALAAPGFWRSSQVVVERTESVAIDPRALVDRALLAVERLPNGSGTYHARYETLWFLNEQVFAPIRAELWVDASNPARHRLEITHAEGGAPYELQIGDGRQRLAYYSGEEYTRSLYGDLAMMTTYQPARLSAQNPDAQNHARLLRMSSGAWGIGPSYLRDAARASDLRSLGRQRDGQRTVQILSYTGSSPLGKPIDAPGATAERVTVLLALDIEDGRLRRATELVGPPGAGQVSNTTWRLVDEQWISAASSSEPLLNINEAWQRTGSELPLAQPIADLGLPPLRRDQLASLAALATAGGPTPWLPSGLPPGTDRAMLFWDAAQRATSFGVLAYFGPGKTMFIHLGRRVSARAEDQNRFGDWDVWLEAGRHRRYLLELSYDGIQPSFMNIQASGFTRAELQAVVESLRPLDLDGLLALEPLFVQPDGTDPAARAALRELLHSAPPLSADNVRYERTKLFQRRIPTPDPLADPYHPEANPPDTLIVERWTTMHHGQLVGLMHTSDASGTLVQQLYQSDSMSWRYYAYPNMLNRWDAQPAPNAWWSTSEIYARELLTSTGSPRFVREAAGAQLIVQTMPIEQLASSYQGAGQPNPSLSDLHTQPALRALRLGSDGRLASFATFLGDDRLLELGASETLGSQIMTILSDGELIERVELEQSRSIALSDAPPALLSGEPPQAALTRDYTDEQSSATIVVRSLRFRDAVAEWPGAIYLLPESAAANPVLAEIGQPTLLAGRISDTPGGEAAAHGMAVRFSYIIGSENLWIASGDAAQLRAYFRTYSRPLWVASQPLQLTIAGRNIEAWLMRGMANSEQVALFAEIDGTLIIAEGRSPWFEEQALPLLAELQLAR